MLLDNFVGVLKQVVRKRREGAHPVNVEQQPVLALKSVGFDDFLAIDMPPRENVAPSDFADAKFSNALRTSGCR